MESKVKNKKNNQEKLTQKNTLRRNGAHSKETVESVVREEKSL